MNPINSDTVWFLISITGEYYSLIPTSLPTTMPTTSPTLSCSDYNDHNNSNQSLDDSLSFVVFTADILLDTWSISADENEWSLFHLNSGQEIFFVDSASYSSIQLASTEACLMFNNTAAAISSSDDCYYFLLVDSFGDGLASSGDGDNFWLRLENKVFEYGEWKDGSSLRVDFCIS